MGRIVRSSFGLAAVLMIFSAFAHAVPIKPTIAATSWALYDVTGHAMLMSENVDARAEPASLTKLMTAYLVFKALDEGDLKLDQVLTVSEAAWKMGGSRMFVEPTKPVTVEELIKGMIVQSGNDATVALAEAVAGSEESFVQMMNNEARRLGLNDTRYANSTGMPDPNHYSSARDVVRLSAAMIRDFPEQYKYYSIRQFKYNIAQPQYNRNRLLWLDPAVDGIKTGHTESAGYCLAASKKIGERRLISVVMGAQSEQMRAQESQKLLNVGFLQYETALLYRKGEAVARVPLYKGALNSLSVGYGYDFHVTVPKGQRDRVKVELIRLDPLLAPIHVGQTVGKLRIKLDDRPYLDYPIFALESVGVAGWLGRLIDTIYLWFQ